MSRMDPTRPVTPRRGAAKDSSPTGNAQPANRKGERMARRELLYTVVREAMLHSGVLTSSYKFKVLSLDARGRQFMVMVDLARASGGETSRLAEIEALIAQHAKSRYDVVVTAVYWRMNEHVALGVPGPRTARTVATPSQPAPLESGPVDLGSTATAESGPTPLVAMPPARVIAAVSATAAAEVPRPKTRFEPIQADEVAAFKSALAAGLAKPAAVAEAAVATKASAAIVAAAGAAATAGASAKAFDGSGKHGPQSYTLLTGFEDTEMPDSETRAPALSGTQYGDLA
ncbi:MAG: hypothetical protein ABIT82_04090 [Ramlibacter sp.]